MVTEELIMSIIVNGGDARSLSIKAIRAAREEKWIETEELLLKSKESINKAHKVQTQLIQDEIRGEKTEITLLMVHAQDHLMNAITVKDLAIELIEEIKTRVNFEKGK